jgi:hypothetical protein
MASGFVAKEYTEFIDLLRERLEEFGHQLQFAHTAADVAARLPSSGADVVLLGHTVRDVVRPAEIRQLQAGVKVVLYSVEEADVSSEDAIAQYGADAALSTLADFGELHALIERLAADDASPADGE